MITIVSGFGRCGSSLVMQMLGAGGMPVTGNWPAFEDPHCGVAEGEIERGWMESIRGCAIKVLDPHRVSLPYGLDYRVIWCSRDPEEQALSQIKFLQTVVGIAMSRDERRNAKAKLVASYRADKPAAVKALLALKPPGILELRFERTLSNPHATAEEISKHLPDLDIEKMAAAVRRRSPLCAPNMNMELDLILERESLPA